MGKRFLSKLPVILVTCLVTYHLLLATVAISERGYLPTFLNHSAYDYIVELARYLDGYIPIDADLADADQAYHEIIDGRRGAAIPWSSPGAMWHELTRGWLRGLWYSDEYKNKIPLPTFLSALAHKISGGSILAVALSPQLFFALMLLSVYGIGRRYGGPWTGVAAAAIASGYPGIYLLARTHHDVLATGAMATAAICLLSYSRGFTRLWICALAGIAAFISTIAFECVSGAALVGMVVAGPFAMEYVQLIGRARARTREALWGMAGLALFLAPTCLLYNWTRLSILENQLQNALGGADGIFPPGPQVPEFLHEYVTYVAYLFWIAAEHLQPVMTLWLIIGAVMIWHAPRGGRLAVALFVLVPLVALCVVPKKASHYIMPILPGFALMTALGLRGIRSIKLRRWAIGLATASGLMMPLYTSLPLHFREVIEGDRLSSLKKIADMVSIQLELVDSQNIRQQILPLAIAGRELVAHDLARNHQKAGPRRVAMFGRSRLNTERIRYVVELSHPRMFVIDFLSYATKRRTRWRMLNELKPEQFDYLIFLKEDVGSSALRPLPVDYWDPVQSRDGWSDLISTSDTTVIRKEDMALSSEGNKSRNERRQWEVLFRRWAKQLLDRRWKRIDTSAGPIYQAEDAG